ncbi:helix-turn-helix transcriptional regulator [Streptomyces xanthophaeus]|uniref:helix-turn-helix transcriptional regulator n=1 Tax=Streptomyces xanthophaeus TaxID=67385 RepID=UPI00365A604B
MPVATTALLGDPVAAARTPHTAVDDEFVAAGGHPLHVHDFHQFLYVPLGRIVVTIDGHEHRLDPSVGLWIPAGVWHSARFDPDSLIVVEAFDPGPHRLPYAGPAVINITGAQRTLLLARMRSSDPKADDPEVFAALSGGHPDSLPLPQPVSRAAVEVARELARRPHDARTATEWAQDLYTSSTSLRRAFRDETGLAFSEWRTRLRLNHSLELLAQGHLVGAVATRVGFTSVNGFIAAFRRHFGETPGYYTRQSP